MSSDHLRLHSGSIINGRLTGIYNPGISVHAGRKVIRHVPFNQLVCPNPPIQWNLGVNQFLPPPHAETSTEGSGVTSPMSDPGLKANVLAHKDLAVETFGVHEISCGPGHNFKSST